MATTQCSTIQDCGREYEREGCLVKNEKNTIFHIKTDTVEVTDENGSTSTEKVRYKQRVNLNDLDGLYDLVDIPTVEKEDRDLTMFTTINGYLITELAKKKQICKPESEICVNGSCRPSSEMTAKMKVAEGCLAQMNGDTYLVNTESKKYKLLTDGTEPNPPAFYTTCLRDAPTVANPVDFESEYTKDGTVSGSWKQHYCKNAAPCSKDDLPVILSSRQKVLAAKGTQNKNALLSVCTESPEVCTLFAPGVTLEECTREPEACADAVLDPKNRCDYFPKGSGCVYRPPETNKDPDFYPFEKYAKILEAYNITLISLGVLLVVGAVGYAVWKRKKGGLTE